MIGAGGLLMTQGDAGTAAHKQRDNLTFPTFQRPIDREREATRTTLAPAEAAEAKEKAAPAHDPLLVALPPEAVTALVFEAGTILKAPVGQAMLACVGKEERARMDKGVAEMGKTWVDLAERVGVASLPGKGGMFVVQGKLDGFDIQKLEPHAEPRTYGAGTTIYDDTREDAWEFHAAVWHGSLLLGSHLPGVVEAAIDRLDSGGAGTTLAFDENEAYGEIYGKVGQADLERMAPEEMKSRLHDVAAHAEVHVDAITEVLMVMDVEGSDAKQVEDLGKSLGAAMAVGRLEARREGRDDVVRLVDQSRVRPYGDRRLRAEVAVPLDIMTKSMHGCGGDE
jgi:hypothetical protein